MRPEDRRIFPFLDDVRDMIPDSKSADRLIQLVPRPQFDAEEWGIAMRLGRHLGLSLVTILRLRADNFHELENRLVVSFETIPLLDLGQAFVPMKRITLPVHRGDVETVRTLLATVRSGWLLRKTMGRSTKPHEKRLTYSNWAANFSRLSRASGSQATFRDLRRFLMSEAERSTMSRVCAAHLFGYRLFVPPQINGKVVAGPWIPEGPAPPLNEVANYVDSLS